MISLWLIICENIQISLYYPFQKNDAKTSVLLLDFQEAALFFFAAIPQLSAKNLIINCL